MYDNFANIYDELFPVSKSQIEYFIELANTITPPKNLLDIGCGTGELVIALDDYYTYISAIDLNYSMISLASQKPHSPHLDFRQMNMSHIDNVFFNHSFSVISCLGNTLVHLPSTLDLQLFISSCHVLLREKGVLVLQILNYDKIFKENITSLPKIETTNYFFDRVYELKGNEKIIFHTTITSKKTKEKQSSETILYPLKPDSLVTLLEDCGFNKIITYSNFHKENFTQNSDVMIIEATT